MTQRLLFSSTYDGAGQLTGMCIAWGACSAYTNSPLGERLSATTGTNTTTYGYDQASRLTAYTAPGVSATYGYDGDGLRATSTSSTAGNRNYTWDRTSGTVPLLLTDGTTRYLYGPGDLPVAEITASTVRYLHTDQANSVRTTTNNTGTVVATATWDAYGGRLATTGTQPRLGWQGQYTDPDTNLVYLRARYYDPTTATFLTLDPLQDETQTPYTYAYNDPWSYTDPSGLWGVHLGPIRIGSDGCMFGTNPNGSCRGTSVASNPIVQTVVVASACTFTGGMGCLVVNGVVVAINAHNRYDPCEGFSTNFLVHTGIDVAVAAVNMRSIRGISGLNLEDELGNVVMRAAGLRATTVVKNYLVPNLARASLATTAGWSAGWVTDQLLDRVQ